MVQCTTLLQSRDGIVCGFILEGVKGDIHSLLAPPPLEFCASLAQSYAVMCTLPPPLGTFLNGTCVVSVPASPTDDRCSVWSKEGVDQWGVRDTGHMGEWPSTAGIVCSPFLSWRESTYNVHTHVHMLASFPGSTLQLVSKKKWLRESGICTGNSEQLDPSNLLHGETSWCMFCCTWPMHILSDASTQRPALNGISEIV